MQPSAAWAHESTTSHTYTQSTSWSLVIKYLLLDYCEIRRCMNDNVWYIKYSFTTASEAIKLQSISFSAGTSVAPISVVADLTASSIV